MEDVYTIKEGSRNTFQVSDSGAGKMALWITCLLGNHEDLRSDASSHRKDECRCVTPGPEGKEGRTLDAYWPAGTAN